MTIKFRCVHERANGTHDEKVLEVDRKPADEHVLRVVGERADDRQQHHAV